MTTTPSTDHQALVDVADEMTTTIRANHAAGLITQAQADVAIAAIAQIVADKAAAQ